MSGTSHDGVDAAIARITGCGADARVELLHHSFRRYPARLKEGVRLAFDGTASHICRMNFELGEFFSKAALGAVAAAGMSPADIDLVGSHGQTIYHIPPARGVRGSTLQIGEGAVIARRTGAVTVTDFRTADMAAGGQGAPLVPFADWILFRKPGHVVALQNIGGMANVTVVTERAEDVTGFDTGPGNSLMDEAARILTGGAISYDRNGKMARSGSVDRRLLDKLLADPFFSKKPPKSTGRETFGAGMARRLIQENKAISREDMLCTLTHLTARSIRRAYVEHVFPRSIPERVVVCGGGAKNGFLVSLIRGLFTETKVVSSEELGIPVQAREPLCFAVLANETLFGNPGSLPAVTGALTGSVLGKVSM